MYRLLMVVLLIMSQAVRLVAEDVPQADASAVVVSGNARFTVLTPALLRMEWSPKATFEDRASLAFINRRLPVPAFTESRAKGWLTIQTEDLVLKYKEDGGEFTSKTLSIELRHKLDGKRVTWKPGMKDPRNLFGTTRTLDSVSGAAPLEPGLLSRSGWALVDDSTRPLFTDTNWRGDKWPWAISRSGKLQDWYFFGHGHDYKQALADFTKVSGKIPLPPRYVFGAWWSRYWPLSDQDFKDLVAGFRGHDIPLDVMVIDMDWHLPGWTGYTWNPKYFPDPEGFLKWLHGEGLRTTLNLHPADGVKSHEKAYPEMARAMGLDPATTETVKFNCADPKFVDAYFKYLHHPLEKQGVDFWWMDWQQQKDTPIPGLDPLFWLNYLHWNDRVRSGDRPLIFSRWGGLGNHRYQIGFSGDTFCNWQSLAFQPYFTSTAANVGYGYWSHDIGGHQPGVVEPELYARWLQWAVFNPVLRTHCTANPLSERRIWKFPQPVFEAGRAAYKLRYELIPYIYSAAREAHDTGVSLCRPLYYDWPELEEAYKHGGEYMFGSDLLVAPVVEPADPTSGCARVSVWLPPGTWTNWFTGRTTKGPGTTELMVALDEIPVFVRAGAIIPTAPAMRSSGERQLDPLIVNIWPGEEGRTRVYEDDGLSAGYETGAYSWLPIAHSPAGSRHEVEIGPVDGKFPGMLAKRSYEVRFRDTWAPTAVTFEGEATPLRWRHDAASMTTIIEVPERPTDQQVRLLVSWGGAPMAALRDGLRGRYKTLADVAALLGSGTPEPITKTLSLRGKATPGEVAEAVSRQKWMQLVDAVNATDSESTQTLRALTRMLGFSHGMKAEAVEDGRIRLTVRADALEERRLKGSVSIDPIPGWDVSESPMEQQVTSWPTEVSWLLEPVGAASTARVSGAVTFQRGGKSFRLPVSADLLPSINAWWVVGPWDNPWEKLLNQVLPPEERVDLRASYIGKDGKRIKWQKAVRTLAAGDDVASEFFVDLNKAFGRDYTQAVAYAVTWLESPKAMDVTLAVGSDDGVAIWLNGKEVHRHAVGRPYLSRQDKVPVHLQRGSNMLLLKISQGEAGWGFGVHVETKDGQPVPEVHPILKDRGGMGR